MCIKQAKLIVNAHKHFIYYVHLKNKKNGHFYVRQHENNTNLSRLKKRAKKAKGFDIKRRVSWSWRWKLRQGSNSCSGRSIHGYLLTYSGLSKGDYSFVRSGFSTEGTLISAVRSIHSVASMASGRAWCAVENSLLLNLPGVHWGIHFTVPARCHWGIHFTCTCQVSLGGFTSAVPTRFYWRIHFTCTCQGSIGGFTSPVPARCPLENLLHLYLLGVPWRIHFTWTCQRSIRGFTSLHLYLPGVPWRIHFTYWRCPLEMGGRGVKGHLSMPWCLPLSRSSLSPPSQYFC